MQDISITSKTEEYKTISALHFSLFLITRSKILVDKNTFHMLEV